MFVFIIAYIPDLSTLSSNFFILFFSFPTGKLIIFFIFPIDTIGNVEYYKNIFF